MIIKIKNNKNEMSQLIEQVSEFLKANLNDTFNVTKIKLIIEELIMNIINYAYPDNSVHEIVLEAEISGGSLNVIIIDDGICFNPFEGIEKKASGTIESIPIGGLGITLIKKFADSYSYQRKDNHNIVRITKRAKSSNVNTKGH